MDNENEVDEDLSERFNDLDEKLEETMKYLTNEEDSETEQGSGSGLAQGLGLIGDKVRLKSIPDDTMHTMISMRWLEFLIEKVGTSNLQDVLEYYYEIGWISESVLTKLEKYSKGVKPFHDEPDWRPSEKLSTKGHIMSLLYIERLKGNDVGKELLDKLEREVKKIEKGAEKLYGV